MVQIQRKPIRKKTNRHITGYKNEIPPIKYLIKMPTIKIGKLKYSYSFNKETNSYDIFETISHQGIFHKTKTGGAPTCGNIIYKDIVVKSCTENTFNKINESGISSDEMPGLIPFSLLNDQLLLMKRSNPLNNYDEKLYENDSLKVILEVYKHLQDLGNHILLENEMKNFYLDLKSDNIYYDISEDDNKYKRFYLGDLDTINNYRIQAKLTKDNPGANTFIIYYMDLEQENIKYNKITYNRKLNEAYHDLLYNIYKNLTIPGKNLLDKEPFVNIIKDLSINE